MSRWSPAAVEGALARALNRVATFLLRWPESILGIIVILVAGFTFLYPPCESWMTNSNPWGWSFLSRHRFAIIALMLFGGLKRVAPLPPAGLYLSLLIAYLPPLHFWGPKASYSLTWIVAGSLALALIVPITVYLLRRCSIQFQIATLILLTTIAMFTQYWAASRISPEHFALWWTFRPERFAMVAALWALWHSADNKISPHDLTHPLHLIYPLPVPPNQLREELTVTARQSGWLMVLAGLVGFWAAGWARASADLGILNTGLRTYLYFFANSSAVLYIVVGLGRVLGANLPSPFRWALLAHSPADSWRRWNIPFYEWFRSVIFLPSLRLTKSPALAVAACFAMSLLLHDSLGLAAILDPKQDPSTVSSWFSGKILFFTLHGIGVYASLRFNRVWPDSNRLTGWLGVLGTLLWLALVHYLVRWQ